MVVAFADDVRPPMSAHLIPRSRWRKIKRHTNDELRPSSLTCALQADVLALTLPGPES